MNTNDDSVYNYRALISEPLIMFFISYNIYVKFSCFHRLNCSYQSADVFKVYILQRKRRRRRRRRRKKKRKRWSPPLSKELKGYSPLGSSVSSSIQSSLCRITSPPLSTPVPPPPMRCAFCSLMAFSLETVEFAWPSA